IANGNIYARGSSDNKGQNFAHIKAVEAYLKTGTELPCDLTFVIEGEEEVGSEGLAPFLEANKKDFACAGVVVSDSGMPSTKHPALTYALRGVAAMEITLEGPNADLHSGIFGGCIENPAMALCQMLGKIRDKNGRIKIPGFYDDVKSLKKRERESFARLPGSVNQFKRLLGVKELFGEKGFNHHEQRAARPTFEINGLTSGYQGEGSKTIVPSSASAKITIRLVPDQNPTKILKLVAAYLKKICPKSVKLTIDQGHAGEPYIMDPESELASAGLRALKNSFHHPPVILREGGSIPIVSDFKRILNADSILLGLGLPDDNLHSPNEKFNLDNFYKGMHMSADLWKQLGHL
ncbi:M20/M25/M40 family metallo-hydrolase, partial [Verrucomicrobia bacterium]|nr:M20/M25/M40 family metallo-hydrolase [Verrucomicrobiota bacterium]